MKKILFSVICVLAALTACDDTTDTLGYTLTNNEDLVSVSDGVFKVASRSIVIDSVISRSSLGYLGKVKDPETGSYISSNFVTQFHVMDMMDFVAKDKLAYGLSADSCDLRLFYSSFYGDSLTSMKATIYELQRPLEEGVKYYSSFDPVKEGLVRIGEGAVKASKVYSLANANVSDSVRNDGYYTNNICFRLNDAYTAKDGTTYNNYGTYIMDQYYKDKSNFRNTYKFLHNVCPGFYVQLDNGVGTMAYISNTRMNVYYSLVNDSAKIKNSGLSFGGTEETLQISSIKKDSETIKKLAADNTCTYVKAPANIFTEMTLPVEEICKGHEKDSISSAKIELKCINNSVENAYSFNVPSNMLLVEKDSLESFFAQEKIADYRRSFVATYSKTSNSYIFGNISQLIEKIFSSLPENESSRAQYKAQHPNWNKVVLVPVVANYTTYQTGYSSNSILTSITNDLSMSSVKLVGGSENQNGDIEISVIYTKFN